MEQDELISHYMNERVMKNIIDYSKDRWVAIHCGIIKHGRQMMLRYGKDGRPLRIDSMKDIIDILGIFKDYMPRTFYATSCRYTKLGSKEDVWNLSNVYSCMPVWDIDSKEHDDVDSVLKIASSIVSTLDRFGVRKSIFLKWSGRGIHVHIHDLAISSSLRAKYHPLDIAYSIVEYIIRRLDVTTGSVNVENKIDPKRVFTCPLSIHRELNRVCVCIHPDNLESFDISWTNIKNFKHYDGWNSWEIGEVDDLAIKSYEAIGPYPIRRARKSHMPLDEQIIKMFKRFSSNSR